MQVERSLINHASTGALLRPLRHTAASFTRGIRYKPLTKLGTGSFGIVTKVVSATSGREYACKSISKVQRGKKVTTPRYLNKIQNEVQCMYQLGHSLDAVGLKVRSTVYCAAPF